MRRTGAFGGLKLASGTGTTTTTTTTNAELYGKGDDRLVWGGRAPRPAADLQDGGSAAVKKVLEGDGGRTDGENYRAGGTGGDDDGDDDGGDGDRDDRDADDDSAGSKAEEEENGERRGGGETRDNDQWDKAYGEAMALALGGGGAGGGIFKRMEIEEWGGGGIVDHL